MERTVESIGAQMDALNLWDALVPYNFAFKPSGTVIPYFCNVLRETGPVKVRVLLLEGWQTMHDYVRTRIDRNFGYYSSPIEFAHLELVVLDDGAIHLFRHDPGYMPVPAKAAQRALAEKILWEIYGLMLRLESDPNLPMAYADEKAVFARVQKADGSWCDAPLEIPSPHPVTEQVVFAKDDVKAAQDLPFAKDEVWGVDFRMMPNVMTREARPRTVYELKTIDAATKKLLIDIRVSMHPEGGLKGLWETMPPQFLKAVVKLGRVPGAIKVVSGRLFRLMRPLCMELPFKLSLHDKLDFLV